MLTQENIIYLVKMRQVNKKHVDKYRKTITTLEQAENKLIKVINNHHTNIQFLDSMYTSVMDSFVKISNNLK